MSTASHITLDLLHGLLADSFVERIRSGEATAADLNAARQFLKDNGIGVLPRNEDKLGNLRASLPEFSLENDGDGGALH